MVLRRRCQRRRKRPELAVCFEWRELERVPRAAGVWRYSALQHGDTISYVCVVHEKGGL